jgi:hypothetical protein
MSLTIRDAEDSFLHARATVAEWEEQFLAEWFGPQWDLIMIMFWENLDPLVKKNLQQMNPTAYQEVESQIEQIRRRNNGPGR